MADDMYVIDDEGDIIFVVGPTKKKLKVSSATLSKVSPVFKALLGPHFRDGQAKRTAQDPATICLPDDQPVLMGRLCELAHLSDVPAGIIGGDSTTSENLLGFAVMVDKYDMAGRLRLQCQAMLLNWLRTDARPSAQDLPSTALGNIIAAAYILKQHEVFETATLRFMRRAYARTSPLLASQCGQKLPVEVLCECTLRVEIGCT
ncbi:hypothetical protein HII31_00776 [Pseudocercospora fuligena]|uniref:BTB domain-containing protein n=1 Tax=Pseudocercospora fuligena TaxID=685502 RepID=A0A8H6RDQ2_9PEZI|nr:hypothetical protein HII31_09999 [Pseudocercospora fuligena]KAF7197890.1 hypothetical protein HII31_00776 [Pseudocercospora fuligena]